MRITPSPDAPLAPRWMSGAPSLDAALGGGLTRGHVHEVYAADGDDGAAAAGFALGMANGIADADGTLVWLRMRRAIASKGELQATGWAELGGAPGVALQSLAPDSLSLLRAAVDALRCKGLGAVILETMGDMRDLDLTASRRLVLAAEKSGVPLFLLRLDASPGPSAARTRWQVAAAPSRSFPGNAPGFPCFDVTLLRQRSGPSGLSWRLEWNRDRRQFRETPLSGDLVSISANRPVTNAGTRQAA